MSERVTDLSAEREARDIDRNLACEDCGSQWWVTAVVIDKTSMQVTGYGADLECAACGLGGVS